MRHVIRWRTGKPPSADVLKDWYTRMRKMGSGLSTARMSLRIASWLGAIKFFIAQFKNFLAREKLSNAKEFCLSVLDIVGGFADNFYYFHRVSIQGWDIATPDSHNDPTSIRK